MVTLTNLSLGPSAQWLKHWGPKSFAYRRFLSPFVTVKAHGEKQVSERTVPFCVHSSMAYPKISAPEESNVRTLIWDGEAPWATATADRMMTAAKADALREPNTRVHRPLRGGRYLGLPRLLRAVWTDELHRLPRDGRDRRCRGRGRGWRRCPGCGHREDQSEVPSQGERGAPGPSPTSGDALERPRRGGRDGESAVVVDGHPQGVPRRQGGEGPRGERPPRGDRRAGGHVQHGVDVEARHRIACRVLGRHDEGRGRGGRTGRRRGGSLSRHDRSELLEVRGERPHRIRVVTVKDPEPVGEREVPGQGGDPLRDVVSLEGHRR